MSLYSRYGSYGRHSTGGRAASSTSATSDSKSTKRLADWVREQEATAKHVPSFYGDTENEQGWCQRYKMRKKAPIGPPPPLSESPFMLDTERFDMTTQEDPEPRNQQLTTRILACEATAQGIQLALQLLSVSEALGAPMELHCIHYVAGLMLQAGKYRALVTWHDELKAAKKAVTRSLPMLHAVLVAYICGEYVPRAITTINALLEHTDRSGKPCVLPDMKTIHTTYSLSEGAQVDKVVKLFTGLPNALMSLLLDSKLFPIAHRLIEYTRKFLPGSIDDTLLTAFLETLVKELNINRAYALLLYIKDLPQLKISAKIINTLATECSKSEGGGEKLMQLAEVMKKQELPFTPSTGDCLMAWWDSADDAKTAQEYFPTLEKDEAITKESHGKYIMLLIRSGNVSLDAAIEQYQARHVKYGVSSKDSKLYDALFQLCFKNHDLMKAMDLLEDANDSEIDLTTILEALHKFCASQDAVEYMEELSLTPSEVDENQTELDRLLHRSLYVDMVAFSTFAKHLGFRRSHQEQAVVSKWCTDNNNFFGQRADEFNTIFSENAVKRMVKGKSFIMVFDYSTLFTLDDDDKRDGLAYIMDEGQASSQQKSVVLVSYATQIRLLEALHACQSGPDVIELDKDGSAEATTTEKRPTSSKVTAKATKAFPDQATRAKAAAILKHIGEFYRGRGDWLKFLNFSNSLDCLLRCSESLTGGPSQDQERTLLLGWVEGFAAYHKQVFLVTEDAETKAQALEKKVLAISLKDLLQF